MKVYINGILYDAEKTPIAIVFDDTKEVEKVIRNLQGMVPHNNLGTPRIYSSANDKLTQEEHLEFVKQAKEAWDDWVYWDKLKPKQNSVNPDNDDMR